VMESGSMRPSVLAERLHIAARSATEVVDALEARGLVERGPDPDDRRATLVRPTEAARTELAEVDRVRREQSERFLAVLSERDRKTLDRILRILVDQ
jgi:DNA-binding MarR family transcriptional regulator